MAAPFARLAVSAGAAVDGVFGELWTLRPQASPEGTEDVNARRRGDPLRIEAEGILGVFSDPAVRGWPKGRAQSDDWIMARALDEATVAFETSRLPYKLRTGDVLVREDTGDRYAVGLCLTDEASGRTNVTVTAKAAQ